MSVSNSNDVVDGFFNFDGGNAMLAALISLLIVILFIIILHIYARWFLAHRHHHHHHHRISHLRSWAALLYDDDDDNQSSLSSFSAADNKGTGGLDPSTIAAIPLFVFGDDNECVICLGNFEEAEVGRKLPSCDHGFHIECIDMWLHSHTTCPICRSPVLITRRSSSSRSEESVERRNHYEDWRSSYSNISIEMAIRVTNHDTISSNDEYDQLPPGAGASATTCSVGYLPSSSSSSSNNQGTSFIRMLSCRNNVNNNTSSELNTSSGAASTSTAAIA